MLQKQRAVIVGAGVAGKELYRELKKHLNSVYEVVGFIDDNPRKIGKKIEGVTVLSDANHLSEVIRKHVIKEVFIAIPSAQGLTIRRIIDECEKEKVIFKIVPRILEIILGKVKLAQIREVQIEDLLGRQIVRAKQVRFAKEFRGKKILVTGAAGSIGSELCRQLIQFKPVKLIAFDNWETGLFDLDWELKQLVNSTLYEIEIGNIQDFAKVLQVIRFYKPDIVFHAAAYKHVPLMQFNPIEAVKNNIFGTANVAEAALEIGVEKFINISTDKAADPTSVMGATKLLSEKVVRGFNARRKTKFISVRFGNVLDSHGSVVPLFRKQIQQGGPVTVTDKNMTRFLMAIPEAVQLVLQASILGTGNETFILDMGEPVRIDDLARLMIKLAGFVPDEEIKIKYIGVRPGEKLSEILTTATENMELTPEKKIFRVRHEDMSSDILDGTLQKLKTYVRDNQEDQVVAILKRFAPNLQPTV